ncbi:hypothetical protein AB1Y20_006137 [Prymnesium parvum]|uniref:Pentatricopeptide repeat-containing protein n=1 Tax=Prymnesium parvum TaxID=97485 RepID=A0AB34J1R1_PRYPA
MALLLSPPLLLAIGRATTLPRAIAPPRAALHATLPPLAPPSSLLELLLQLRSLRPLREASPHADASPPLPLPSPSPSAQASPLSREAARARARAILADSSSTAEQRAGRLALLAGEALAAHRLHSARLVFELAQKRVGRWRATGAAAGGGFRALLRVGALTLVALREQQAYEALLSSAEELFAVELAAETELLSELMVGCCEAGWAQHAAVINGTLHDRGALPSTAAHNAMMEARLRRHDSSGAFDIFIAMRRRGPPPDRRSHEIAARAAAERKASWNGLRNLMRRPWLKVPWNPNSANAALAALIDAGKLGAASGAISHMLSTAMPLDSAPLLSLLDLASCTYDSSHDALLVFTAVQQQPRPIPPRAFLLLARHKDTRARVALFRRAADEAPTAAARLHAWRALALCLASGGEAEECASLLRWLHREGFDLRHAAADELARVLRLRSARLGGAAEGAPAGRGGGEVDVAAEARRGARPACLWLGAIDASDGVATSRRICDAMAAEGELRPAAGRGVGALLAHLCVCAREADVAEALAALEWLGGAAPAEAFVLVVEAACAAREQRRAMGVAAATVERMREAGALAEASAGELLRLYCSLIRGFGLQADLRSAYATFEEACDWLEEQEQELWGEAEKAWWRQAERAIYQAMVNAAAPHPRGLLLACKLLEQLQSRSGQRLAEGYYRQLINGHATAHELSSALSALQGAYGRSSLTSWRVSDATVASLMEAISRATEEQRLSHSTETERTGTVSALRDAGLALDRKVEEYLQSGRRMRGSKHVNLNDDLVVAEREGLPPKRVLPTANLKAEMDTEARGGALSARNKQQYAEFEELLAQRADRRPTPSEPKPPRDTKRSVGTRTLRNLQGEAFRDIG